MMGKKTHYQVLGIEPGVSFAEIKRAYRRLVKDCHPDVGHSEHSQADRENANEFMMSLNEAYETLKDRAKRSAYDTSIGLNRTRIAFPQSGDSLDEDLRRERYLRQIFHPSRQAVSRLLNTYQRQIRALSLDIYDDRLLAGFEEYADKLESSLRRASEAFSSEPCPRSLDAAVQMMRYAIAQAADGLEEMRFFCQNFDYDHLTMAGNLFRIATDLCRQSLQLSRG